MNIIKTIQRISRTPYWKQILSLSSITRAPFYLVGGTIRDLLLERPVSDLDIVVSERAMAVARHFARLVGGAFVPLDWESETARVVLPNAVFDFSAMKGETIEEDLSKRDFTINSLAVEIEDSDRFAETLIDPFSGLHDLHAKRLAPCSDTIFMDDPLRILRAYRLVVSLGLTMTEELPSLIKRDHANLSRTSSERIRDELFLILSCAETEEVIRQMDTAGILSIIFPEIDPMKETGQDRYHHLDVWGHSVLALKTLEHVMNNLPEYFGQYSHQATAYLERHPVHGRPIKALVKLATLFHDVGKPETYLKDEQGKIHFYGHAKAGGRRIGKIAKRLKLSRRESCFLENLVSNHMHPDHLLAVETPSLRSVGRFFRKHGEDFWALFCIYYADFLAKKGPEPKKTGLTQVRDNLIRVLSSYYEQIRPKEIAKPLLTGRDLIETLGLTPGPPFKEILEKVHEAYVEGRIQGKGEALELVKRLLVKSEKLKVKN
ncbi:MAG: HD domain-containing protein [Deltaproteobacteria bacterium]|nr:HD domain-containing protein [Deltaproteobacteria bacterium]